MYFSQHRRNAGAAMAVAASPCDMKCSPLARPEAWIDDFGLNLTLEYRACVTSWTHGSATSYPGEQWPAGTGVTTE